jgi:hypothetical protein
MSGVLSAATGIRAIRETSESIYVPGTILAVWSQFGLFTFSPQPHAHRCDIDTSNVWMRAIASVGRDR